jgi:hypothetical protein
MRKKSHLLGKAKVTVSRLFAVYLKELKRPLYDFVTCKRVYKAINSEQVQTSPKQLPVFRSSRRFATHFGLGIDQEKDTYYQSSYFPMQQEYV